MIKKRIVKIIIAFAVIFAFIMGQSFFLCDSSAADPAA